MVVNITLLESFESKCQNTINIRTFSINLFYFFEKNSYLQLVEKGYFTCIIIWNHYRATTLISYSTLLDPEGQIQKLTLSQHLEAKGLSNQCLVELVVGASSSLKVPCPWSCGLLTPFSEPCGVKNGPFPLWNEFLSLLT